MTISYFSPSCVIQTSLLIIRFAVRFCLKIWGNWVHHRCPTNKNIQRDINNQYNLVGEGCTIEPIDLCLMATVMIMVLSRKMIVMVIVGRSQLQASISDMLYKGRKCPEWHISPRAPHSMKFWHISPGAPKSEKCWHILPTAQPSVKCVQESDWCYHFPQNSFKILSKNKLTQ